MNKTTEALKLAENTLEDIIRVYKFETGTPVTTLAAIREARAEQEVQEPVAKVTDVFPTRVEWLREVAVNSLLYAAPVERHWYRLQGEE